MNLTVVGSISEKILIYARARLHLSAELAALIIFLSVGICHSTGLILSEKKQSRNAALDKWRENRTLAIKHVSGAEKNLVDSLKNDPSGIVRQGAAQQLGGFVQNPLVVRALADALRDDKERSVRYACALSLALSPTFKSITALEKSSQDPDPDLRRQIAFSLKHHLTGANKIKATKLLKRMQKDPDVSVRMMAGAEK